MNSFKKSLFCLLIGSTLLLTLPTRAHDSEQPISAANNHAPISVMGDHTHKQNEWMLSYRFMQMHMDDLRSGSNRISANHAFAQGYTVLPEQMDMEMHMLGLMYAPSDQLTLMLMTHYISMEMEHRLYPGAPMMLLSAVGGDSFVTQSSGWGDTSLSALYNFYRKDRSQLIGKLGLSLPTGDINQKDRTPMPGMPASFPEQQLPASMQLGSGTFDLLTALTFVGQWEQWSWGAQGSGTLRLEDANSHGYRLGHRFEASSWLSYQLDPSFSLSSGLRYQYTGKLHGQQEGIGTIGPNGRSVTTAFEENYGGERIDINFGANYLFTRKTLKGHRLAAEIHLPIWQNLNGIQLETDWSFTLGWQKAF